MIKNQRSIDNKPEYVKIVKTIRVTSEIRIIYLNKPSWLITYTAGSHIVINFKNFDLEISRTYSLISLPSSRHIAIAVKKVKNGVCSDFLINKAKTGDSIKISDAYSYLNYKKLAKKKLLLFAAGIGITPILSIIRTLNTNNDFNSTILMYSASNAKHLLGNRLFNSLNEGDKSFRYFPFITNNTAKKRITINKLKNCVPDIAERNLIYCGPTNLMNALIDWCVSLGMDKSQIHSENISNFNKKLESSKNKKIIFSKKNKIIFSHNNDTILDASKNSGISLPSGCRIGRCGVCKLELKKGEIEYIYKPLALSEKDKLDNKILTCCSIPKSDLLLVF